VQQYKPEAGPGIKYATYLAQTANTLPRTAGGATSRRNRRSTTSATSTTDTISQTMLRYHGHNQQPGEIRAMFELLSLKC